jgi:hypothetical protein
MDPVASSFLSGSVGWPWVGALCVLFFLCGGTIAWILGYHAGRMDGRVAGRNGRIDDDQSQIVG